MESAPEASATRRDRTPQAHGDAHESIHQLATQGSTCRHREDSEARDKARHRGRATTQREGRGEVEGLVARSAASPSGSCPRWSGRWGRASPCGRAGSRHRQAVPLSCSRATPPLCYIKRKGRGHAGTRSGLGHIGGHGSTVHGRQPRYVAVYWRSRSAALPGRLCRPRQGSTRFRRQRPTGFETSHAHQPRRLPVTIDRTVCQKIRRQVELASLKHPVAPVQLSPGGRFSDVEGNINLVSSAWTTRAAIPGVVCTDSGRAGGRLNRTRNPRSRFY
jgi:hypothetical protein